MIQNKPIVIHSSVSLHTFDSFGLDAVAYVKPILMDGQLYHSIHAADGTTLSVILGREKAFALVRQHDMEPASVH